MIKVHSAFIDNNENLKCYSLLINKTTCHNNALHLVISNNSDNKVCIPKDMTIFTSEEISNGSYNTNEITLTARLNDKNTAS